MTEASPLVRQWNLLRTLSARRQGVTVRELAAETGMSAKTIRRDLETFQTAGFPLAQTVESHGRKKWHIDATKYEPGLAFAYDEAVALYLGRRLLEPLAGTVFWSASRRAFAKIRSSLGAEAVRYIDQFAAMFHQTMVGASDYSKKADLIDRLMVGIEDCRAMSITYQSLRAAEPAAYGIHPLGLSYHRGSLYLVGLAPPRDGSAACDSPASVRDQSIRHWKVDRIEEARLEERRFKRPDGFDLQTHFAKSFGVFHGDGAVHVRVRFAAAVARYVQESTWHVSQRLTKEENGGLLAEFDLDGTEEILRWILSFGRHAEVLEPAELRARMTDEIQLLAALYPPGPNLC
jgi:proteasome accessory factor B